MPRTQAQDGRRAPRGEVPTEAVNEVRLVGRLGADPQARELPSGDEIVQLRLVVRRSAPSSPGRPTVDTIDATCWSAVARRAATRLRSGELVEVQGALRRRFFRTGGGAQSRYDVEVWLVRRVGRTSHRTSQAGRLPG